MGKFTPEGTAAGLLYLYGSCLFSTAVGVSVVHYLAHHTSHLVFVQTCKKKYISFMLLYSSTVLHSCSEDTHGTHRTQMSCGDRRNYQKILMPTNNFVLGCAVIIVNFFYI